jgi:very-short-patch-repair endonuclease
MRRSLTPHEAALWRWLKTLRARGYHFRRQAPFRGYYLDFVCYSHRLVIEVDGSVHMSEQQAAHDRVRDAVLERQGFRVLRFWNGELEEMLERVQQKIIEALAGPPPWPASPACPSPQGGGR